MTVEIIEVFHHEHDDEMYGMDNYGEIYKLCFNLNKQSTEEWLQSSRGIIFGGERLSTSDGRHGSIQYIMRSYCIISTGINTEAFIGALMLNAIEESNL